MARDPTPVFYVYLHVDSTTKEVVYVGKGKYGRAWDVTRVRAAGHHKHCEWLKEQSIRGFLPIDWVVILHRGLSEPDAFDKERTYWQTNGLPLFNRGQLLGEKNYQAKLTNEQVREIFKRCFSGESKPKLAKLFGVSNAAIHHIANRKQWTTITRDL